MKALSRFVLAAIAILASVAMAAAQTPSGIVNRLEVQRLVDLGTPSANFALADHFAALSARYTADAARHRSMAKAYLATSPRSPVNGAPAHCEHLATLADESAAAADEMAMYHEMLAEGIVIGAPPQASRFYAGQGAPEPTAADLHQLATLARTPADHRSLAEYYTTVAAKNSTAADAHAAMARSYRAGVFKGLVDPGAHCERQARQLREAARQATEAATFQLQLANVA